MVSSTQITTPTYSFLVFSDKLSYMEEPVSLSFQEQIGGSPIFLQCGYIVWAICSTQFVDSDEDLS